MRQERGTAVRKRWKEVEAAGTGGEEISAHVRVAWRRHRQKEGGKCDGGGGGGGVYIRGTELLRFASLECFSLACLTEDGSDEVPPGPLELEDVDVSDAAPPGRGAICGSG